MNQKLIIGAVVASIIMFVWQFMAWSIINLHRGNMQYTPNQDAIMEVLNNNLEEGSYFIPNLPETATQEEHQAAMENSKGKPWAQITYHKSWEMSMGMNMFRGWAVDLITMLLFCWILMKIANLNFKVTLLLSLSVGLIGYLSVNYLGSIWFETSTLSALIDAIIQWGLIGAWLGWWLNR